MSTRRPPAANPTRPAPLFDRDALRRQVGAAVYDRGEAYFESDAVLLIGTVGPTLTARVVGNRPQSDRRQAPSHASRI
jgi:uncharacterized Zn finger protein